MRGVKKGRLTALGRIVHALESSSTCLLGVGPVSKNVVDAAIELAYQHEISLMLIASRRQVECERLGSGYVERWSTRAFARYVRERDPENRLALCRDHGGPWQNSADYERRIDEKSALDSAIASFREDIDAGFDILHIDTGVHPDGEPPADVSLRRLLTLYQECTSYAKRSGRQIAIEVGTEDQKGNVPDPSGFETTSDQILRAISGRGLPAPLFLVAQTGTRVFETVNVGDLVDPKKNESVQKSLQAIFAHSRRRGFHIKAHNCDFLPTEKLAALTGLGLRAANIAPEFAVAETRELLAILEELGLGENRDRFVQLVLSSGKWKKWIRPGKTPSARECAEIAGHYVYAHPQFQEIKAAVAAAYQASAGQPIDSRLRGEVRRAIGRLLEAFRLASGEPLEKVA
jgi:hypothetical protein